MGQKPKLVVRDGRLVWAVEGRFLPYVRGGEGATGTLDSAVAELRSEIEREETSAREKKAEADRMRDDSIKAGKNPILDDALFGEYDERTRESDSHKQRALDLRKRLEGVLAREADRQNGGPGPGGPAATDRPLNRSERRAFERIAERFLASESFERLRPQLRGSGRISQDPVEVLSRQELIDYFKQRTTVSIGTAGSVVPIDQQVWPPVTIPVRQVRLLDLISTVATESNTIDWVQQTVRTDVAVETPYGTPAPEADYEFALRQASVKRLPQFIPTTRDVLADQGQLQGFIEGQLQTGVNLSLEQRILAGVGSSPTDTTFQGILNTAGIGVVTMQDSSHAGEYELDAIHRAITVIRLTLYTDPTSVGLHPTTYETVILKKDAYGQYLYPVGTETNSIWGLQPIITPVFTLGQGLVGDYRQGATLWLREGLSVSASTEHEDYFVRGMIALLAELRAAFAVTQPRAFCLVNNIT